MTSARPYQALLDKFTALCLQAFGDDLVGVYLHGSLALGCFHPDRSDIDLLTVVRGPVSDAAKRVLMDGLLPLNAQAPAKGIEMSVIPKDVLRPFVYPTPFELHFSPMHLARYQQNADEYIAGMKGVDPDLAAHCMVLQHGGLTLFGEPISQVFGPVPPAAYLDSCLRDLASAEDDVLTQPVYVILNLCRTLAYCCGGLISSKQHGGQWALQHLPAQHHALIRAAMEDYAGQGAMQPDHDEAITFIHWALHQLYL